jgi:hypothetical protein
LALIKCSECGRTVSDKAKFCVGCGAPLERHAAVSQKPVRPSGPAPSRKQLLARTGLSPGARQVLARCLEADWPELFRLKLSPAQTA